MYLQCRQLLQRRYVKQWVRRMLAENCLQLSWNLRKFRQLNPGAQWDLRVVVHQAIPQQFQLLAVLL